MPTRPASGRLLSQRAGRTPRGWPGAISEVILLAVVLLVFTRLHNAVGTDLGTATANAQSIQSIERILHCDVELTANRWLVRHPAPAVSAVLIYRLYYLAVVGVLAWTYLRHPADYLRVRRTFMAMAGIALLVFWLLPTSPPRFALPGIIDVVADRDILARAGSRDPVGGGNLSAMPSLHVGWTVWCAYGVWSALRGSHPRAALLAWLFPMIMVVVVLGTGSHYVLDVLGSAVLLMAAVAVAIGWNHLSDLLRECVDARVGH